jgi:hypothetical protein
MANCAECKVGGTVVEVLSHELGPDAAMAVLVFTHDPFVAPDHVAPFKCLSEVLGERALRFYEERLSHAPGVRYLDGAE